MTERSACGRIETARKAGVAAKNRNKPENASGLAPAREKIEKRPPTKNGDRRLWAAIGSRLFQRNLLA
jgi:hypothetical protein